MVDSFKRILWPLRTVEVNLRAISDLFEARESCEDILLQLTAVRGAFDAVAAQLLLDQGEKSKRAIRDDPFLNRRSEELERLVRLYSICKKLNFIN